MYMNEQLLVTTQAEALIPYFVENGELHTLCMDPEGPYLIPLDPDALMELNLQLAGSSLQGSRDSARAILGSSSKAPVVLSRKHDSYWMPMRWDDAPSRGWVNESQIRGHEKRGMKCSTIYMKSGNILEVPCSTWMFESSTQRVRKLRSQLDARDTTIFKQAECSLHTYRVQKGSGLNYEITEEDRKRVMRLNKNT